MAWTADDVSLDKATALMRAPGVNLRWGHVFMLPRWQATFRAAFPTEDKQHTRLYNWHGEPVGLAALSVRGTSAAFIGDAEICDYFDFAVAPGREPEFYNALLEDLNHRGVTEMDLRCLRPDATVFPHLEEAVHRHHGRWRVEPDGVSLEMGLPRTWEEYLGRLNGKQRHEVRRKLRRLDEAGEFEFRILDDHEAVNRNLDPFLNMFRASRVDKAVFMNPGMESFFRSVMPAMAEEGVLKIFMLFINGAPAAANVCFDFQNTVYLYNSAYDPDSRSLSAGLLCKILSIRHSIESGRGKYDFLKGDETYKQRLGGREVHLSRCRAAFK